MHIERQYRELEKIEEVRVYNINNVEFAHFITWDKVQQMFSY